MTNIVLDDIWRLADIIAQANDGDTVLVRSHTIAELGRRTCQRMGRDLVFEVAPESAPLVGDMDFTPPDE